MNLLGQTLANRYDILALLGSGGMGEVYCAHDRELDEMVALKVISFERASDPAALAMFRHEVKLARRVTHRNIARVFELGSDRGITYCTMELVGGVSLAARLAYGKLSVGEAATIAPGRCLHHLDGGRSGGKYRCRQQQLDGGEHREEWLQLAHANPFNQNGRV